MAGTTFNNIHSFDDLGLLQAAVEVSPAEPKTSYIELAGGDGSLDLTEALGRVFYKDRTIEWTFKLYPSQKWEEKQTEVSNALNGLACKIVLDTDSDYYYEGRVTVNKYTKDKLLHQITVSAQVRPYKYKLHESVVSVKGTTSVILGNSKRQVSPVITTTAEATINFNGAAVKLEAGRRKVLDIVLQEGDNLITVTSEGVTTFTYQEGDL